MRKKKKKEKRKKGFHRSPATPGPRGPLKDRGVVKGGGGGGRRGGCSQRYELLTAAAERATQGAKLPCHESAEKLSFTTATGSQRHRTVGGETGIASPSHRKRSTPRWEKNICRLNSLKFSHSPYGLLIYCLDSRAGNQLDCFRLYGLKYFRRLHFS